MEIFQKTSFWVFATVAVIVIVAYYNRKNNSSKKETKDYAPQ